MFPLNYKLLWKLANLVILILLVSLLLLPPEWLFSDYIEDLPELLTDKVIHIVVFILWTCWLSGQFISFFKIFFYTSIFGFLIEVIQYFLPYRSWELLDLLANEIGIFIGVIIAIKFTSGWSLLIEKYICYFYDGTKNE